PAAPGGAGGPALIVDRNETNRGLGLYDQAVSLHTKTLAVREAALGPDHPNTLQSRNNLANAYKDAGRLSEAIALHQATLKLKEAKLGPDHPSTLESRGNLATAYQFLDRWVETERLLRNTLTRRQTNKPDSPLLADELASLGRNLLMQS